MTKIKNFLESKLRIQLNMKKIKLTFIANEKAEFLGFKMRTTNRKSTKRFRAQQHFEHNTVTKYGVFGQVKCYITIAKLMEKLVHKGSAKKIKILYKI